MKQAFHYIVKAKLIRNSQNKEIDFVEFEEKFENENPIIAREKSFDFYQNYIDVLLQGKEQTYISDRQAREELQSHVNLGVRSKFKNGDHEIEFNDSFGNGIGIFIVIENPINDDKIGEELFLHGIGTSGSFHFSTDGIIWNLSNELSYYRHYNYGTNNKELEIVYCNSQEWAEGYLGNGEWKESYFEPNTYHILKTPFDWSGFDKPYWWGEPNAEIEESKKAGTGSLEDLIYGGENNQVEFKPSLLFNFSTNKAGIGVKAIIAKTICSFLNSNGGFLLIGIKDNGEIQGLDYDFKLSEGRNPKDFFRLEFDQMLEHFLSFSVKDKVSGEFYKIDDGEIFVISVWPSTRRPIFFKGQNEKEFYVRGEASTRQLKDIEEIVNYCIDKWTT